MASPCPLLLADSILAPSMTGAETTTESRASVASPWIFLFRIHGAEAMDELPGSSRAGAALAVQRLVKQRATVENTGVARWQPCWARQGDGMTCWWCALADIVAQSDCSRPYFEAALDAVACPLSPPAAKRCLPPGIPL